MARKTREETLETRERLLDSAFDVMSEKPFSRVTMSEIAERVGLSKGAAYWHFKNKNELLVQLVRQLCMEAADDPLPKGEDFPGTLGKIRCFYKSRIQKIARSKRFERSSTLLQRKLEWPKEVHDEIYAILQERLRSEYEMVEGLLAEAQKRGEVRADFSPGEIASLIAAIFFGLFVFFGPNPLYPQAGIDLMRHADLIFDAFDKELAAQSE